MLRGAVRRCGDAARLSCATVRWSTPPPPRVRNKVKGSKKTSLFWSILSLYPLLAIPKNRYGKSIFSYSFCAITLKLSGYVLGPKATIGGGGGRGGGGGGGGEVKIYVFLDTFCISKNRVRCKKLLQTILFQAEIMNFKIWLTI